MTDPTAETIVKEVTANQDFQRIFERESVSDPGISLQKYLNYKAYILTYFKDAELLGLTSGEPRSVLDIGTGVGYFQFICSKLGHKAFAIDVDEYPIYNEAVDALGVERTFHRIEAFRLLPDMKRHFDLVTAFAICFNNHKMPNLWGRDEWAFFLRDLANNHLNPGGKVFLRLNIEFDDGFGKQEVRDLMSDLAGRIVNNDVAFDDASKLKV
jgi:SAM-dependent methyltransferase